MNESETDNEVGKKNKKEEKLKQEEKGKSTH